MNNPNCAVCDASFGSALYRSQSMSLTSLCRIQPEPLSVFACPRCAHLQTEAMGDVNEYYDSRYDILVDSDEEDQIYEVRDGATIFRTRHQVDTLIEKLGLDGVADLLDYGCAKSSTIRAVCSIRPGITPHLFDVSERYIPFWAKFVAPENWAVHFSPGHWKDKFDVVTSFFSLEHIPAVAQTARSIAALLKPGGRFYAVVPNVLTNVADFIVADHCNHFTRSSLARLMSDAGLELLEIDDRSHRGALVLLAQRPAVTVLSPPDSAPDEVMQTLTALGKIARFWEDAASRLRAYEESLPPDAMLAVYGAGFYGAFIAANLARPERIACHLDQNPFLQDKSFNDRPVISPEALPADVRQVLVGLNPSVARRIVSGVPALMSRDLEYFFL